MPSYIKQEITSNIWQPTTIGEELAGNVVDIIRGQYGDQLMLNVEGKEMRTPSHKHLQAQLSAVKKGMDVKIVYEGAKPSGKGNDTQLYSVYVKSGA